MAEKYKRKHLRNLDELDKEQEKIRRSYRHIEDDWISGIINPQQIALSLAGNIFSRAQRPKKKNKKDSKAEEVLHSFSTQGNSSTPLINIAHNLFANPAVKGFLKRTATSWLRWQAFNLAVYLGKKAYKSIKHKREEKKLKEELSRLSQKSFKK